MYEGEILHCPECGELPYLDIDRGCDGMWYRFKCGTPDCAFRIANRYHIRSYETGRQAVDAWNDLVTRHEATRQAD